MPDIVQNSAQRADGHAHSVRAAKAAELPAAFEVRLGFEEEARRTEGLHPPLESRANAAFKSRSTSG